MTVKISVSQSQEVKQALKNEFARLSGGAKAVLIGFPEGSGSYDDGETIAGVAAFNEFGTESMPARPFLRPGVQSGNQQYLAVMEDNGQALIDGDIETDQVMRQIGEIAVGKVKEYIINLSSPPNADSTTKKKKSSNPLIDTGAMAQAVTSEVVDSMPEEGI